MSPRSTVLVFPAWVDNPFLNLLSLAPRGRGTSFAGATSLASLESSAARLVRGDVLHVHWTAPIAQRAPTAAEAMAAVDRLEAVLEGLADRGVAVVWTIHNRLPHELRHREAEVALHRVLAARADLVHVMAPDTPQLMADVCEFDVRRVRIIPHPVYSGVYGERVPKSLARARLGVAPDAATVLFLGQVRPYKGLDVLFRALERVDRAEGPPTLLLAGMAKDDVRQELEETLPHGVPSVIRFGFVDDADVPTWFSAADLAVFPYRAILNSGSLHLAAAFGVPTVIPGEPHLRAEFGAQSWVGCFDLEDPVDSLAREIAARLASPVPPRAFEGFARERSPWRISLRYADLLDEAIVRAASR